MTKTERERKMIREERIKEFLKEYKTKNSYLQDLCESIYEYYKNQLIKYYIQKSNHPYPNEMITEDELINMSHNKGLLNYHQRT
jgi:hypothetical protein